MKNKTEVNKLFLYVVLYLIYLFNYSIKRLKNLKKYKFFTNFNYI